MKTNIKHVFAKLKKTPLFAQMDKNNAPICSIEKGNWIGAVSEMNGWYYVITTQGNGYVKVSHTCKADTFKLRVLNCAGGKLAYAV